MAEAEQELHGRCKRVSVDELLITHEVGLRRERFTAPVPLGATFADIVRDFGLNGQTSANPSPRFSAI